MNLKKFYDDAISIQAFLSKYLGVSGINNKTLTHEQVKHLFPDIKRSSFEVIIKNPELIYTGKVILVKDFKGEFIPYYDYHKDYDLDSREKLIVELVIAITEIVDKLSESLIILENNDSVASNFVDLKNINIDINSSELVKIISKGGVLVSNNKYIYTFQYLLNKLLDYNQICYSKNYENASQLSEKKDIISINITNKGRVYITFNGETNEKFSPIDIKNFLLKFWEPKDEEIEEKSIDYDLDSLEDYELEYLFKKFYKERNMPMYFKFKGEYSRRKKNKKEDLSHYKTKKRKLERNWEE